MHAIYRHNIHLKDRIHGYRLQSIKPPHFSENPEPHDQADAHEHAQNNDYLFFRTFFHTLVIKFVFSSPETAQRPKLSFQKSIKF